MEKRGRGPGKNQAKPLHLVGSPWEPHSCFPVASQPSVPGGSEHVVYRDRRTGWRNNTGLSVPKDSQSRGGGTIRRQRYPDQERALRVILHPDRLKEAGKPMQPGLFAPPS